MNHATPDELRSRAKDHLKEWRALLPIDAPAAREHLDQATNLALLADEAEQAARKGGVR